MYSVRMWVCSVPNCHIADNKGQSLDLNMTIMAVKKQSQCHIAAVFLRPLSKLFIKKTVTILFIVV